MNERAGVLIIAIDGPAGAGKSTVAKALARRLNISYLDTGAMYRALTLKAISTKTKLDDQDALAELARKTKIELGQDPQTGVMVFLDGKNVTQAIRTPEVTNSTFHIARAEKVRAIMVDWQQAIGTAHSLVAEGRDIGTVVFPDATYKFYLDADLNERAQRRLKELAEGGKLVDPARLQADMKDRDHKDMSRQTGPLKKADDAISIDSTHLTAEQVVESILKHIGANARP